MLEKLFDLLTDHWIVSAAVGLGLFYLASYLIAAWKKVAAARAFERSRQEAMAYVAEGTMSPEHAAMLLAVGNRAPKREKKDPAARLAQAVWWGEVDKADADRLIEARSQFDEETWARTLRLVLSGMNADDAIKLTRAGASAPKSAPVNAD